MPQSLNLVDWLLLLIVALAAVRGCLRGFRAVLVEFGALLGGLFAALRLTPSFAQAFTAVPVLPVALPRTLVYVATFGVASAALLLLGRMLLLPRLRLALPSLAGAFAGLLAGVVVAALVAALLLLLPLPTAVTRAATQSRFTARLAAPVLRLGAAVVPR